MSQFESETELYPEQNLHDEDASVVLVHKILALFKEIQALSKEDLIHLKLIDLTKASLALSDQK